MLFPCFGVRDGALAFEVFFRFTLTLVVFLLAHRDEVVFQVCCTCFIESIISGPVVCYSVESYSHT